MNLLIHADPGARSGFIGAWLTNCLHSAAFDVGRVHFPKFCKVHELKGQRIISPRDAKFSSIADHRGVKIRVRPSISTIDLHCLLFLKKNVQVDIENFTKDEYSIKTFEKLDSFSREILASDSKLDYNMYDIVLDFSDTFNTSFMIDLYHRVNNSTPSEKMIKNLEDTNIINSIKINKNHACSIVKLCLEKEQTLGLDHSRRLWSIDDIYKNPVHDLYDLLNETITPKNYY